jgi:glycerol-3-phosphate acyltransferase PlsY
MTIEGLPNLSTINAIFWAYVLGSVPSGFLVGMLWQKDPRAVGSGNPGSANVFRFISPLAGVLNFLLDAGKGYLAVLLACAMTKESLVPFLAAVAVVAGHNWMLFLKFRGGKGLATSVGALSYLSPAAIPAVIAVMAILILLLRDSNTAAAVGILSLPFYLLYVFGWAQFFAGVFWVALIVIKFWPDLQAYRSGRRCLF